MPPIDPIETLKEQMLRLGVEWSAELSKIAIRDLREAHVLDGLNEDEIAMKIGNKVVPIALLPYYWSYFAALESPGPPPPQLDSLLADMFDSKACAEFARRKLDELLLTVDHTAIRTHFLRHGAPNWVDIDDDSVSVASIGRLAEAGIPITWVPPARTIVALVHASPDEYAAVLAHHSSDIVGSCREVLAQVNSPALVEQTELAREAVEVARLGQFKAAQALASSVFDTVLRRWFDPSVIGGRGYYKNVRKMLLEQDGASGYRERATLAPVANSLADFIPSRGDGIPATFNRHASSHAAGRIQYTTGNSLVALMLTISLLREVQERPEEEQKGS
jgi:hypothetical protein